MAGEPTTERLRFSSRSVLVAIAMLAATLALLRLVEASTRVIGWIVGAAVIAGLLYPAVHALSRRIPRALAVLLVAASTVGAVGFVGYRVVDTIVAETDNLKISAPRAARELEESPRWGELAREFRIVERTERFVDEVPERLRGGDTADALRSAATRGVAFLATGVLALFFVLYGPALVDAALGQIANSVRRARVRQIATSAYRRSARYAAGTIAMSVTSGLIGWAVASIADVRGAAALGLWLGLWDIVPVVGLFIGALPIVLLAAAASGGAAAWALVILFALYQVFEARVVQRWVERRSVHIGPFVTVVAGLVGIETYGLGGAVLLLAIVVLGVAVLDEVAPAEPG
jgi:predicted PurR-regulated permease PerM